ncbi:MAG: xanthine dehydrogenase family protein subunit M [Granulosicoccus sp.]
MDYAQPKNLDEALRLLASDAPDGRSSGVTSTHTERWAILSGGTDLYPGSLERPLVNRVLDIHALSELKSISFDASTVRIGAGVTWSDVIDAEVPPAFNALKLAARELGSVQIQNKATVVGNLCNASPAADGVPPLLILNASVELRSLAGIRQIPLQDFILGNRQTASKSDEMVTAIVIPAEAATGRSAFLKLGARKYLVISISMVAARLACDDRGLISEAAVSVGSCSLVAQRLTSLEAALQGQTITTDLVDLVTPEHLTSLSPIEDVRSSSRYRLDASLELVRRTLTCLTSKKT